MLLLVDMHNLIHRAYHALPALSTSAGLPTHAALGVTNTLLRLLEDLKPERAICVFDAPVPSFRHEQYEPYKAQRPHMAEDLVPQIPVVEEVVDALGLRRLAVPGYEADDVMAALATQAGQAGEEVVVVSNDVDLLQAVSDRVKALVSGRRLEDSVTLGPEQVCERLGVRPDQVADYKALVGDPSDNLPGVPGIGPKTAVRLLEEYGTLEALYASLHRMDKAKLREVLEQHREQAFRWRELVRLRADIQVPVDWRGCAVPALSLAQLVPVLDKYEFRSVKRRLLGQAAPAEPAVVEAAAVREIMVEDEQAADEMVRAARESARVGLRVAEQGSRVVVAVAPESIRAFAVAWDKPAESPAPALLAHTQPRATVGQKALCTVAADPGIAKATHDAKGAYLALWGVGADLQGVSSDTAVADWLLDPNRADHPVGDVAKRMLSNASAELAAGQVGAEACAMLELAPVMGARLRDEGLWMLFEKVELPLAKILAQMERTGVKVDAAQLRVLSASLAEDMRALEKQIFAAAGVSFNLGSSKQLQEVLYQRLGLKPGRRTKTGYSTDSEVLKGLADAHPVIPLVLRHREVAKLYSTYGEALAQKVDLRTGRIHTNLNQTGTSTGRLSSSDPNLQNIPARTELGTQVRRCFVAGSADEALLSADYSQIELRILAQLAQEPVLQKAFAEGVDIHIQTACALFGVDEKGVTPDMRRQAKTVNFGVIYGMGPKAMAADLGLAVEKAKDFIDRYFATMPRVREHLERSKAEVRELGFAVTMFGRKRPIPEIHSPNQRLRAFGERAAANAPIQGTAADIIKLAMVELSESLPQVEPKAKMLLQVHDELLFEVPGDRVREVGGLVKQTMEGACNLGIPIKVDVKVGLNWADMEPLAL